MASPESPASSDSKAENSSCPSKTHPPSSHPGAEVLSTLATSTTTLIRSVSTLAPSAATDDLNSSTSTKSSSRGSSSTGSSSAWAESSLNGAPSSTSSNTAESSFRSRQPASVSTVESEFSMFGHSVPVLEEAILSNGVTTSSWNFQEPDGLAVSNLLSIPLADEIFAPPLELPRVDLSRPIVHSFATCDDPVEFLLSTVEYTEDVWGDLVGLVREAREEIIQDKGKGKGKEAESNQDPAVGRLRQIWRHLKMNSKL